MRKVIASYGAGEAIAKGLNVLLTLCLAALVDIQSYGTISLFLAMELVLIEFMILGQHSSLLRFYETYRHALSRLYSASLILILLAAFFMLLLIAVLPIFEWNVFAGRIERRDLLFLGLGVAMHSHVSLYLAYLRAAERPYHYCVTRISYQFVRFVSVGAAVVILRDASAYPLGVLIANAVFFLGMLPKINSETEGYSRIRPIAAKVIRDNAAIGIPLTLHTVVIVLYSIADRFFLARLVDQEQLAIYSFAAVQGSAIFFVINVLALAYVPKIYRGQRYSQETELVLLSFLRAAVLGTCGLAVVVYFVVFPLSLFFVATEYREGGTVLLLALTAGILQTIGSYGIYKLTSLRSVAGVPFITLGVLICNIILNWLLIPRYGIEGAAVAAVVSQFLAGTFLATTAHFVARSSTGRAA